jgi:alkanesulfonate monooxygenase SsuD/methylene tetrahydromethanopterin reductase-like flavin-dependent oxidoreductase (luciferase family)
MVESIQIIRRLWDGEHVTHEGKYFQMQNARLYDLPEQPVPIYISAMGPKTMRIAGEHGDGLITAANKVTDKELINEFREGARSAGKNPDTLPILAELFVFVGREQDAQSAAEKWRFLPKTSKYLDVADPRKIWRMAQNEVPIDEVLKTMTISEDPQAHIDRLQALIDGGVTHIFVHSGQEDQQRVIDFYGRQVLPKLQHEKMMLEVYP